MVKKKQTAAAKPKGPAKAPSKVASHPRNQSDMPPMLSDLDTDGSDDGHDAVPARATAVKKAEPLVEPENDGEEEEDDGDEDGDGEDFVVEKIVAHGFDDTTGTVKYLVKWLGYPKKSDQTWEPLEHLVTANEALETYHDKIGGEPVFEPTDKGKNKGKRGAAGDDNPKAKKKVRASNGNGEAKFELPQGSWEPHVTRVVNIINDIEVNEIAGKPTPRYTGMVEWNNRDRRTQHALKTLRSKCPQKLLDYYEAHLKFTTTEPQEDDDASDDA